MDISLETKSCEHISFQEASRLMIMQENAVLIPQNICIHKGIFIPKNAKVKDYENAFLKWNMIVTRSDDNSEHLLATSLSSSWLISAGSICHINLFGNDPDLMVKHGIVHLERAPKVAHPHKRQYIAFLWTSWNHDDYMRDKFSAVMGTAVNKEHDWDDMYYTVDTRLAN